MVSIGAEASDLLGVSLADFQMPDFAL